jgi:zinc D-Ala-D-Ala dipeptidase
MRIRSDARRVCVALLSVLALGLGAAQASAAEPAAISGGVFHVTPARPVTELLPIALAATPPAESGDFRPADLVELTTLDPTIRLDIRYATTHNFLGTPLYSQARAFLQRPAAEALVRVQRSLAQRGYGLLVHDAYRPWYVTKIFWDAMPPELHRYVADPAEGSRHNRGCAVDLTLYELKTGREVEMPSVYDEPTERAYPTYAGGTAAQRTARDLLRRHMETEGFTVYEFEWWHFDYRDWKAYAIQNVRFEDIRPR